MRTKRIELEGSAGHVAIERPRGSTTIRIDCIIREPLPGRSDQAWKTWEVPARVDEEELFKVAQEIHLRVEGRAGSNSDVHDVYRELQRFAD